MSEIDIIKIEDGADLKLLKSDVSKAGNVLSVQQGALEYAQTFGVDLTYFLNSELQFQNSSFKAYLVNRLLQHQVNVANVLDTIQTFFEKYTFAIGDSKGQTSELIA